ncbi:hypothetical protein GC173_06050 [bacterium]|nr:hypothetical protein [bacterium]
MFRLLKSTTQRLFRKTVLSHNLIDSAVMSRILGMNVLRQDFQLTEDHTKNLAPGVFWRRRRFQFLVEEQGPNGPATRHEGLCVNELTIDSHAKATISPRLAGEYPDLLELPEVENAYWATTFAKGALRDNSASNVKESRLYVNMGGIFFEEDAARREELLAALAEAEKATAFEERFLDTLAELDPRWVEQPAGGYAVARFLPAFPASRLVQSSSNILAATNAGYFLNFPEEYNDGVSALHQPLGGHMVKGRVLSPPWISRPGFIGYDDGSIVEGIYGTDLVELHIEGLSPVALHRGHFAEPHHGAVWRFFDQSEFPAPDGAAALMFTGSTLISAVPAAPGLIPPKGGVMVLVEGDHAKAVLATGGTRKVSLKLRTSGAKKPVWMISAGPFLVRNSVAVPSDHMLAEPNAGEFRPMGPAPTRFPFDVEKTRAPRTALGRTSAGGMKMVVVDGRRSGEHSCGVTLEGLASLMAWVGCESAINLDGGGSSVMAIEGAGPEDRLRENLPYCVVNIPSDDGGRERIVPILVMVEGTE